MEKIKIKKELKEISLGRYSDMDIDYLQDVLTNLKKEGVTSVEFYDEGSWNCSEYDVDDIKMTCYVDRLETDEEFEKRKISIEQQKEKERKQIIADKKKKEQQEKAKILKEQNQLKELMKKYPDVKN